MPKKLIIQTDISVGSQWGDDATINFIREVCIPSVKNYCIKNDYEHLVIKESRYEKEIKKFDFFYTKLKHYAFERYYYLDNGNYDSSIYLDNDIYIFRDSEPLPEIHGLMLVKEPEGKSSKIFKEVNNLKENFPYYNSGVIMCDPTTAKQLCEYMFRRLLNYERAKGKNTDNMMLNEYLLENQIKLNFVDLESKWNYMPFLTNGIKIDNPNFYHFVGKRGKTVINHYLKYCENEDIEIENFLRNANFSG